MAHLVYGLDGGEDLILITGEIGTGKTLALNNLAEHLVSAYKLCLINVTQINFRELLKIMLAELDIEVSPQADRADLLLALKAELVALRNQGQRLLVIIDEAQNLELGTLEGVRLLTNLGPSGEQALQIILAGQPSLRGLIDSPEMAQLRQRIRVHYHLDTLSRTEVGAYVKHRLKVAGCERPLFDKRSLDRIHRLSGGIPRLVNIIADRALLAAFVDGKDKVSLNHVDEDEGLARSPSEETFQASHAARGAESPLSAITMEDTPPTERQRKKIAEKVIKPKPAIEPTSGTRMTAPPAPMATPRPAHISGRLLSVSAIVVLLALAVFIFWPYLRSLPQYLPGGEGANATGDSLQAPIAGSDAIEAAPLSAFIDTTATEVAAEANTAAGDSLETPTASVDTSLSVNDSTVAEIPIKETPTPIALPPTGPVLHVGSFRDSNRAEVMAGAFRDEAYTVVVRRTTIDGGTWFRVYIGPFRDRAEAREVQREIEAAGMTDWSMLHNGIR